MRDDREKLLDILEAIDRIEKRVASDKSRFAKDELLQVWVIHHLEIVGEACRALSDSMKAGHPEIPWNDIIGMRNILIHEYFGIDTPQVWMVVERDLPALKVNVRKILASLP